ncbi:hypothetical protein Lp90_2144 [Lactiplantibacillus plantarum]|uniref:Uncharacterized protein n=2 Tax=Lactiplantibacillus plantarum TaxID=1590 RepID=A0A165QQS7_LACPN|nr:hypothetical protein LPST_C2016 [Lactiplantibacillus plantarum ST-III]EFK29152.1 hypothetical protein HMPREF0531_11851 [Lactiplantibacillus plantarum subsp. plantarum ATCC 14917 = JCM 1149 = CGMCC 1.2437]ERL42847.1 hypothetical protein N644_3002 [Lactiplantibacillus paraplantarum]ERO41694.1 hypothetical protein LPLWJ_11540 [Lactiplantibacillus plantarum WJL]KEZ13231.1 hypothetical protein Lp90_2144 [Lactiplantibacillus plantarum]DAO54856.1 MAG TPA: hypothetical protein [Caudoviricetes sp.]
MNKIIKTIGVFVIVIIKMLGLVSLGWKPITGILILLYLIL